MKTVKALVLFVAFFSMVETHAQLVDIGKTAKSSAVNQANNKIYNGVNQGVNSLFEAPGKIFRKVKSKSNQTQSTVPVENTPVTNVPNAPAPVSPGPTKVMQGSDFQPGRDVILLEDFSAFNAGDFPDSWATNGSGEVRTVDGQDGKWLQISTNGTFAPSNLGNVPENFTLEFDAIFNPVAGKDVHYIMYLYSVKEKVADFKETNYPGNAGIYFAFNTEAGEVDAENFETGKAGIVDSHLVTDLLKASLANKVHVALSKQKSKVSLYINGSLLFDSPGALAPGYAYNGIKFGSFFMGNQDFMLITNLKVATN